MVKLTRFPLFMFDCNLRTCLPLRRYKELKLYLLTMKRNGSIMKTCACILRKLLNLFYLKKLLITYKRIMNVLVSDCHMSEIHIF